MFRYHLFGKTLANCRNRRNINANVTNTINNYSPVFMTLESRFLFPPSERSVGCPPGIFFILLSPL